MNHFILLPFSVVFLFCLQSHASEKSEPVESLQPNSNAAKARPVKEAISFSQAIEQSLFSSYQRKAAEAGARAYELQSEAVKYLYMPKISISGNASRYHYHQELDTTKLRNGLNKFGSALDQSFKAVSGGAFPDKFNTLGDNLLDNPYIADKTENSTKASLNLIWPIYTGGRIDAVKSLAKARSAQSRSELKEVEQTLYTVLAKRYYGVQLASIALNAREKALQTIKKHDHLAKRFYEEGLIARYKRLEAKVALADAEQEVASAKNRFNLAKTGLKQLLNESKPLSSPLFVNTHALKAVSYYQNQAIKTFTGFAKLEAKSAQIKASKSISQAAFKPTVSLFGRHEIKRDNPQWIIGVNVSYTLWSNVNRFKMIKAASLQQASLDALRQQIHSDVKLLVEKKWIETQDALARFHSYSSKLELAVEQAELLRKGFAQGLNTALEAIDAETQLAKVRTEQAKASYDYIMAFAQLLETTGIPQTLVEHQEHANIHIKEVKL